MKKQRANKNNIHQQYTHTHTNTLIALSLSACHTLPLTGCCCSLCSHLVMLTVQSINASGASILPLPLRSLRWMVNKIYIRICIFFSIVHYCWQDMFYFCLHGVRGPWASHIHKHNTQRILYTIFFCFMSIFSYCCCCWCGWCFWLLPLPTLASASAFPNERKDLTIEKILVK